MDLITLPVPDGTAQAYLATPPDGSGPGVLLAMDAIGLRPRIAEMADRIASWGYVVLAPNVFYREGSAEELAPRADLRAPGEREAFFATAMPRVHRLNAERTAADLAAYLDTLQAFDGVVDGPVGVVGYCMGARIAVRAGTGYPDRVAAVGGFHGGGLCTDQPDSPHLGLGAARAEFVFGHADQDRSMPAAAVAALGEALDAAGLRADNEIYAGAAHGYTMADTPMYDEAATERHFGELRELFDRTL